MHSRLSRSVSFNSLSLAGPLLKIALVAIAVALPTFGARANDVLSIDEAGFGDTSLFVILNFTQLDGVVTGVADDWTVDLSFTFDSSLVGTQVIVGEQGKSSLSSFNLITFTGPHTLTWHSDVPGQTSAPNIVVIRNAGIGPNGAFDLGLSDFARERSNLPDTGSSLMLLAGALPGLGVVGRISRSQRL